MKSFKFSITWVQCLYLLCKNLSMELKWIKPLYFKCLDRKVAVWWQFFSHDPCFYDPNVFAAGDLYQYHGIGLLTLICCLLFKVSTQLKRCGGKVNRRWKKRIIKVTEDKGGQTDVNKRKKVSACCYYPSSSITSPLLYPASIRSLQRHATVHHSCTLMHIPRKTTLLQITGFRFQREKTRLTQRQTQ